MTLQRRCKDVVATLCLLGRALSVAKDLECAQADSEYYLSLHWTPMQSFRKCWDPVHMCDSTVLRNPGLRSEVQKDSERFALDPCTLRREPTGAAVQGKTFLRNCFMQPFFSRVFVLEAARVHNFVFIHYRDHPAYMHEQTL